MQESICNLVLANALVANKQQVLAQQEVLEHVLHDVQVLRVVIEDDVRHFRLRFRVVNIDGGRADAQHSLLDLTCAKQTVSIYRVLELTFQQGQYLCLTRERVFERLHFTAARLGDAQPLERLVESSARHARQEPAQTRLVHGVVHVVVREASQTPCDAQHLTQRQLRGDRLQLKDKRTYVSVSRGC